MQSRLTPRQRHINWNFVLWKFQFEILWCWFTFSKVTSAKQCPSGYALLGIQKCISIVYCCYARDYVLFLTGLCQYIFCSMHICNSSAASTTNIDRELMLETLLCISENVKACCWNTQKARVNQYEAHNSGTEEENTTASLQTGLNSRRDWPKMPVVKSLHSQVQ